MKLTQQLLSISEESAVAKSAQTQAELLKAHQKAKKISADQGVVQHVNKDKNTGRIYASDWYDDDETIASYNNGKLKQGPVKEASELNDVTIDDMEDKKEPGANKKADEMEVGDAVKIVGGVEHDGEKGTIERFGHEKKFVVVKFKDGSMNSFHSSDVEELLGGEEDEDDDDSYDEDPETFYVAFYDEDEHHSWIGKVTKADGGKWHEEKYQGKPDYRWGTSYMSYLKPQDVMNWIHKDYRRGMEIEGPFFTPAEAIEYAEHNWGSIKESVEMNEAKSFTDFDAWKQAVLTSYPQQAKKIKFKGRMEGSKDTISAEIPGEDRSYGVWDQDEEKGVVLSEGLGADAVALVKKLAKWLISPSQDIKQYTDALAEFSVVEEKEICRRVAVSLSTEQLEGAIKLKQNNPYMLPALKAELAKRKSVNEDSSAEYGVYRKETYIAKKNGGGFKKGDEIYVTSAMYAPEYRVRVNDDEGYDFPCDYKDLVACGAVSPKKKVTEAVKDMIEAHGIKGMSRTPWRRTFKDEDAMVAWAEKFDAEIYGQRETDYAAQMKKDKPVKESAGDDEADKDLVKEIKDSLDNGDDYTARANIKLITNPALKKEMQAYLKKAMSGVNEDVHSAAVEWFKAEKPEECPKCKSSDFYRTSFGHTQKIVCQRCGQVAAKKDIKEGVVSAVKGFVKHQANKAKANTRGWETFGKGLGAALRDRGETDPKKKAENERVVKQSVRDSNRYRDFADGGKGFNSTKRTTSEKKWDDALGKVKGTVQRTLYKATNKDHDTTWAQTGKSGKHMQNGEHTQEWQELDKNGKPTGQREWRNMAGEYVGEGAANDRLQARAKELLPVLKGPFKKKESVVAQCAKLAAEYFNSAGLQKAHDIDDYIKMEMKKRGITEGVKEATEKVKTDMAGAKCSDAKCKGHFKETSMNDDMDGKLHCDKCGKETQRYVAEAHGGAAMPRKGTVAYNIIMKRKEEENKPENIKKIEKLGNKDHMVGNAKVIHKDVEEGFSPFKPNARVKIISGPKDVVGKEGTIGEVVTTNGQKSYTVDYDHDFKSDKPNFGAKSVRLQPKDIKLIRDTKIKEAKDEQLEVVNKDYDTKKKVFFTGTYEECKEFMRTHKSLKMDLMYKESGRLASYKL